MLALIPSLLIVGATPVSHSPVLGRWAVDVGRMSIPPEARPKSATITFSEPRAGKWQTDVDIFDGNGSERHMWGAMAPDGTPAPIEGDKGEADNVAIRLPAPNVLVMQLVKNGVPASTRVYTVASDGKSMIETAGYAVDGKPFLRTNYFKRVE